MDEALPVCRSMGMSGKHISKKRKRSSWWLLLLLPLAAALLLLSRCGGMNGDPPPPKITVAPEQESGSIAIPGYEYLTLTADTKERSLTLPNPEVNTCWFLITLALEDGTQLWQSDYIAPGTVSEPIKLDIPLTAGSYKAVLRYQCFRMNEERSGLNGAETKLTLRVVK